MSSQPTSSMPPAGGASGGPAPSADTLYSNGLRDITSGKYDLARQNSRTTSNIMETPTSPPNAQFYLGEIAYSQKITIKP